MNILLPVLVVCAIALVLGLGLALASIIMAVPVDKKAEEIQEVLPGANCGACGFSGCSGYASALSKGDTNKTSLCAPGGADVAAKVAEIMGVAAESVVPQAAMVMCRGNSQNTDTKLLYSGAKSCRMASQLFGGPQLCSYGCIGFGDCVQACPYGAISICDGVAVVNPEICRGCKICVSTCPKGIIKMVPVNEQKAEVLCSNHDKGAQTRKMCDAGCIGCMKCVKACEHEAVKVENALASVDMSKCVACGKCIEGCPTNAIQMVLLNKTL
ncbi:MAG: RnfABCDGE type electron transport complex subunit B [Clostridiales bacterium]|nr:RnfABCDGE type electron transport complex subunit B [Clostridiales bacterium]